MRGNRKLTPSSGRLYRQRLFRVGNDLRDLYIRRCKASKNFSVDQSNAFYYADQKNDRFILGQLQPQGEAAYLLSCQDPNNAAILPDQELTYDGKGFSITIQDELYVFQKTDDVPSIIGDTTRYS